jgi:hypothetical protein
VVLTEAPNLLSTPSAVSATSDVICDFTALWFLNFSITCPLGKMSTYIEEGIHIGDPITVKIAGVPTEATIKAILETPRGCSGYYQNMRLFITFPFTFEQDR